jgi:hypothetical protein
LVERPVTSPEGLGSHEGRHRAFDARAKTVLITYDLKKRLDQEFFARLVSQLMSSAELPLLASHPSERKRAFPLATATFEASIEGYGRLRMAALQT